MNVTKALATGIAAVAFAAPAAVATATLTAAAAHADCSGVPASYRPTCVQNDAATYLSDLYVDKVPGSDQDHLNMALQVSQARRRGEQPGTIAETLAQNTGLTLVQAQDVVTEANFWMYPNFLG
jgi:hypothetical protein